jgi:hypothetical protein
MSSGKLLDLSGVEALVGKYRVFVWVSEGRLYSIGELNPEFLFDRHLALKMIRNGEWREMEVWNV